MDSNSPSPYKVEEQNPLDYSFVNRDGITYHAYFLPVYVNYPEMLNTYSFNIEPEDNRPHPIDRRIALTVVAILKRFFENMDNAMIMVCDSSDGKQQKRRNLFGRWFHYYNDGTMTNVNQEIIQGDYELLVTLYFKTNNPFRQQLLRGFADLMNRDLFEIVI